MKMINLLPEEYIRQIKIKRYMTVGAALIILECLGAVSIAIQPMLALQEENLKKVAVERQLSNESFEEVLEINKSLDAATKDVQTWENNLATMEKDIFISTALLDTLLSSVPLGVTINTLDIQEETYAIQIEGRTTNYFTAMGYITQLQSIYPMGKVTFEIGESEEESIYRTFSVTMELPLPQQETEVSQETGVVNEEEEVNEQ